MKTLLSFKHFNNGLIKRENNMYIFTTTIHQAGGASSDATLMYPSEGKRSDCSLRQYFQRHSMEDVEYHDLAAFCIYLEDYYFKDGRSVFYQEQSNSHNFIVYTSSPYEQHRKEIFTVGEFIDIDRSN